MKSLLKKLGPVCAIVGGQWGDEGKGKLVDILSEHYDIVARATGGANAGHTIYVKGKKFVFHLVPAGMMHPKSVCVIGNGTVIHLPTLFEELEMLEKAGVKVGKRLKVSDRAHLVLEYHKIVDRLQEEMKGASKVGTTGRGIGPAYGEKISRTGIHLGELLDFKKFEEHYQRNLALWQRQYRFEYDSTAELRDLKKLAQKFAPFITDTPLFLHQQRELGKSILLEGANGTLLDVDHGTYPFVTSSNASIGGIISGMGISPMAVTSVIGIVKAYVTRVGSGPFPTELNDLLGEHIRQLGNEFGATTGRPRRCGWFDAVAARYAVRINGLSSINLTKLDILSDLKEIRIGVAYRADGRRFTEFPSDLSVLEKAAVEYKTLPGWQEDISKVHSFKALPKNCRAYVETIEKSVGCWAMFIGTGKNRNEMIVR